MRKLPDVGTIEIAPSILSADFACLAEDVARIAGEVKILHIDVMDGHFVPNITVGPVVVKKLRPHFDLFFDAHLMISDAPKYAPEYVKAGADGITFHLEAVDDAPAMIKQLRDLGVSVGVSIKPKTPVEALEPIIGDVDMVLLMSVEPGFGGQKFMPEAAKKIAEIRQIVSPETRIEVDGGIDTQTGPIVVSYGADTLVAGNAIFSKSDPVVAIQAIREACG